MAGPIERHWLSRLRYCVFGVWPETVAQERMAELDDLTAKARVTLGLDRVGVNDGVETPHQP